MPLIGKVEWVTYIVFRAFGKGFRYVESILPLISLIILPKSYIPASKKVVIPSKSGGCVYLLYGFSILEQALSDLVGPLF